MTQHLPALGAADSLDGATVHRTDSGPTRNPGTVDVMSTVTDMPTSLSARVARRARGLAAENGLSQAAIAAALGTSQQNVSRRMSGQIAFTLDELEALAGALGTSLPYLLGLTDSRNPHPGGPDGGLDVGRARRDSNPKPSDPKVATLPVAGSRPPRHWNAA